MLIDILNTVGTVRSMPYEKNNIIDFSEMEVRIMSRDEMQVANLFMINI